jgi:hypothetical protein
VRAALNGTGAILTATAAVSVHPEAAECAAFRAGWECWNPGVRLVLITEIQPRRWRYRTGNGYRARDWMAVSARV